MVALSELAFKGKNQNKLITSVRKLCAIYWLREELAPTSLVFNSGFVRMMCCSTLNPLSITVTVFEIRWTPFPKVIADNQLKHFAFFETGFLIAINEVGKTFPFIHVWNVWFSAIVQIVQWKWWQLWSITFWVWNDNLQNKLSWATFCKSCKKLSLATVC